MVGVRRSILQSSFAFILTYCALSASPARAEPERRLRVCSQNLYHFGEKAVRAREKSQLAYLTKRILRAECDIVAVQEVIGGTESEAATTLSRIAHSWEAAGAEKILSYVGTTKDKFIRNGFLVRSSVGRVVTVKSFLDAPVPSLSPLGPVLFFQRAPMALVQRGNSSRRA